MNWVKSFREPPVDTPGSVAGSWVIAERIAFAFLGLMLLLAGVYFVLDYQPYVLANSDFFRIQSMAQQFMAREVPEDFKQMPLVPLLMMPLVALLPVSSDPYLHALSIINIVLSLGILVLVYFLARVFLSALVALVPVILVLAVPQFTVSAHQPMLEPTIGFFSLATLLALAHRPSWAYALAGLAALTRYELAILLPIVFLVQVLRTPREWFHIGLASALAATPFVIWFGFSVFAAPQGNPYFDDIVRASLRDVAANMLTPFPNRHFGLLFLLVGGTVGVFAALRKNRDVALAILLFLGFYLVAHFFYGRPLDRYSYPVQWVVPLLAVIGFRAWMVWFAAKTSWVPRWLFVGAALGFSGAAILLWLRAADYLVRRIPVDPVNTAAWYLGWSTLWGLLIVAVVVVAVIFSRVPAPRAALAASFAASLVMAPLVLGGGSLAGRMLDVHYDKAEMVFLQSWLVENIEPGAVAVIARYHELHDRMPNIHPSQHVAYSRFEAETHEAFVRELDERGIRYVVFLHRPERPTDESHPLYGRNISNYMRNKIYLMDPFRHGDPVDGFERLATLPAPHPARGRESHVYSRGLPATDRED